MYEVEDPNGVFVVFANKVCADACQQRPLCRASVLITAHCLLQAIHFVNAGSLQVVKTITQDQSGQPLTNAGSVGSPVNTSRTWNDAAFLQVGLCTSWLPLPVLLQRELTHRGSCVQDPTYAYVFVNEGDIYQDQNGTEYSYVTVIDTISQDVSGCRGAAAAGSPAAGATSSSYMPLQIVGRVRVGALPVHGYSVVQRREYWAHSDVTGEFFVISLDNINATEAPVAVRCWGVL